MTKKNKEKSVAHDTVVLCYRGHSSGDPRAGVVRHTAPLAAAIGGKVPLVLTPGLCVVEASLWAQYEKHPPIAARITNGSILVPADVVELVSTRDQIALIALIEETHDRAALKWLHALQTERANPLTRVIDAIAKQVPKCRPAPDMGKRALPIRKAPAAANKPSPSAPA